jgi:hypothetical protein
MASGINRVVQGAFHGTGATKNVDKVGFRPKLVRVVNIASGGKCRIEWFRGMADDTGVKTATAGDISVLTSLGITPRANGFAFGADTDLNVSGELCHFEAHE